MTGSTRPTEPLPPTPAHEVRLERRGRFLLPTCSCGWLGTSRLTESAAREEARDHALLYAGVDAGDDITPGRRANGAGSAPAGSDPAE